MVFNNHVNRLPGTQLTTEQLKQVHKSPMTGLKLPTEMQNSVKSVYSSAFTEEIRLMVVMGALIVVGGLTFHTREVSASTQSHDGLAKRNSLHPGNTAII